MGFSDQLKRQTDAAKAKIEERVSEVKENAERRVREVLGSEASLIKSIHLDLDVGKFHSVDAPQSVIDRLRDANLLKD